MRLTFMWRCALVAVTCAGCGGCLFTESMWDGATAKVAQKPALNGVVDRTKNAASDRALVIGYQSEPGVFMPAVTLPVLVPIDADGAARVSPARDFTTQDVEAARDVLSRQEMTGVSKSECPCIDRFNYRDRDAGRLVYEWRADGHSEVLVVPKSIPVPDHDRVGRMAVATLLTPVTGAFDTLDVLTLGMFWWTDGFGLGVSSSTPGLH